MRWLLRDLSTYPDERFGESIRRQVGLEQYSWNQSGHRGMQAHIGVESKDGIVHALCSTAASASDVRMLPALLHGGERKVCHPTNEGLFVGAPVWGDGGYQGQTKKIREAAPDAQDMICRRVKNAKGEVNEGEKRKNRTKSRVRAKVEWLFRILKRVFGLVKVHYSGVQKNHEGLCAAFASANIDQHRKRLMRISQSMFPVGA